MFKIVYSENLSVITPLFVSEPQKNYLNALY